jgi:hypothetical protein
LRKALQLAIELEHSTIPPYLYALFSLKPDRNAQIGQILASVVVEEMLHMAIACNVLNAVGGRPIINNPHFIPNYPGPLPAGVEDDLKVGLCPFSPSLVRDVFMKIEEPETKPEAAEDLTSTLTIGQFYETIKQHMKDLDSKQSIFTGDARLQVQHSFKPCPLTVVTDFSSALQAIETVVQQGEGQSGSECGPDGELSHYGRFREIVEGQTIVGHPLVFDPCGVYPVICQAEKKANYSSGTAAFNANNTFNYTYAALLSSLHNAFNGHRTELREAIGLMESLKVQAACMMDSITLPVGRTCGPTFEYQCMN